MESFYPDIAVEAFIAQLLPFYSQITLPALHAFGHSPLVNAIMLAVIGAFLAAALLYVAGRFASRWLVKRNEERYIELAIKLKSTLLLLFLVLGSPLGFAIAFAGGLFRVPFLLCGLLGLIGLSMHYGLGYGS